MSAHRLFFNPILKATLAVVLLAGATQALAQDTGTPDKGKMVEKPKPEDAPSNLAIIGRYILTPDIFQIIRDTPPGRGGEVQITDAIATQAKNGKVLAYKFKGNRFDCGRIDGFVQATNYVYENYYSQGGNYPDLQA